MNKITYIKIYIIFYNYRHPDMGRESGIEKLNLTIITKETNSSSLIISIVTMLSHYRL